MPDRQIKQRSAISNFLDTPMLQQTDQTNDQEEPLSLLQLTYPNMGTERSWVQGPIHSGLLPTRA